MNSTKKNIYFIGIGGIGMSALARYFVANGNTVAGYDKTKSILTDTLQDLGITIHFKDEVSEIRSKNRTSIVHIHILTFSEL